MPAKTNPLKLNTLQAKTLVLFQALARVQGAGTVGPGPGEVTIQRLPDAHGDHFHLGNAFVMAKDATGLHNKSVWNALTRKGLARADWPNAIVLTTEGLAYDTGIDREILRLTPH